MATFAELTSVQLRNAAGFFLRVGGQNPSLDSQMSSNAATYERVANRLDEDPLGTIETEDGERTHGQVAARLLREAAKFLRNVGSQDESIWDEMFESAKVFEALAEVVEGDPTEVAPEADDSVG